MEETITSQTLEDFIYRYRKFTQDRMAIRLVEFMNAFGHIKAAFKSIKVLSDELEKSLATTFNIFSLLGVDHYEVTTHSAMIGELLSPEGSHGQGYMFLENFINYCRRKYNTFHAPSESVVNSSWIVEREKCTSYGRLDLVITSYDLNYMIVIENKIYAVEQLDQLQRYSEWMKHQRQLFQHMLIYLTPSGSASSTVGDGDYFCLSYHEDISAWLSKTLQLVKALRVRETLTQYLEIIKTI